MNVSNSLPVAIIEAGHVGPAASENASSMTSELLSALIVEGLISSARLTDFLITAIFVLTLLVFVHLGPPTNTSNLLYLWR